MGKAPPSPFGPPIIGGGGGQGSMEERIMLGMFSNINTALNHMLQGISALNVRLDELTSVTRLQTLIQAKGSELPVDLGLFVRVAKSVMHPHLWGLVLESNPEEEAKLTPEDLRAMYVAKVAGWAESIGLTTKIYGSFEIRDLEELKKRLEAEHQKAKEDKQPKDDEVPKCEGEPAQG